MNLWLSVAIFLASLALSAISSLVLARTLDKLGARLHTSEALLRIITALGADTPEISSAVTALIGGHNDLGLGVVLGSNIFNLAALLGLSAVVAGQVAIGRQGLLFNGGVAALVTVLAAALALGWLPPVSATAAMGLTLAVYAGISALPPERLARLPLPGLARRFVCEAVAHARKDARKDQTPPQATWLDALALVPALASIVLASVGMVRSAVDLAARMALPHSIVGLLVLATLTGLPNVVAAMRLARRGRGAAVVSEALNSNSLNLLAGISLPALVLGLGRVGGQAQFEIWWLLGMTVIAIVLTCVRGGLHRWGGAAVIALYLVFIGIVIAYGA